MFKTFRHLMPFFRRHKRLMILGVVTMAGANLLVQAVPLLLLYAVDELDGGGAVLAVAAWAFLRVAAVLVLGGLRFGFRWGFFGLGRRVEHGVRGVFFSKLLGFSPAFFNRWLKGDLLSRAMSDLQTVRESIGFGWLALVDSVTAVLFTLPFLVMIDPYVGLWSLAPMVLMPPIIMTLGRRIRQGSEELQDRLDKLSQAATESFSGVRVIQAYARREQELGRFRAQCEHYRDRAVNLVKMEAFFWPLLIFVTSVSELLLFYLGGGKLATGEMTLGEFVAMFDYLAQISWPVMAAGFVTNLFVRGKVSVERINQVADESSDVLEATAPSKPAALSQGKALLHFESVTLRYLEDGPKALDDLTFSLQPGEWLGIAGPTGAGKSSILRLVARLWDPQQGRILLDGLDLRQWPLTELRSRLGMVTQEPFLFSETVGENIRFGRLGASFADTLRYAKASDLHETVTGFPKAYDTMLGEKGVNLSGGQKQRVALARALAMRPRLLLLDDAFSAVDTATEERIVSSLREELPATAVLLVSHRISTLRLCDRVLVLEKGRLSDSGRHEELLQKEGFYFNMARREERARRAGLGSEA